MTPNYVSGYDEEEEDEYGEETGQKKRRNKGAAAMGYDDYDEEEAQDYDDEQDEPMFDEDGNEIQKSPAKKKGKKGEPDDDNIAYFDMDEKPNNLADDGVFEETPKDPAELLVEPFMDVFLADDSTDLVPVSYRQVKKW